MRFAILLFACFQQADIFEATGIYSSPPPVVVVEAPQPQRRYLAMFTATWCGPCQTWKRDVKPSVESAGHVVRPIEMTEQANCTKYGSRIARYPAFVAIDWNTGAWLSDPIFGGIDLATAVRMLDGSNQKASQQPAVQQRIGPPVRLSPPVRYIQWPGWGTIDLETYNRNCNCSMCVSIRARQQEYRRQLEAFQQSQTQVTPDQEGTPHGLVSVMLDSMDLRKSDVIGDLGCGDGRILIAAAKRGIRGIGIELDPARAAVARANVGREGLHHLITIETGDALEFDLNRVTCATCYLYPPLLAKLSPKLKSLRVVASPYHAVPGLAMTQIGDIWIAKR